MTTSSPTYPAPIDVLGMSTTGVDGYDTVRRILRDLELRAFYQLTYPRVTTEALL